MPPAEATFVRITPESCGVV